MFVLPELHKKVYDGREGSQQQLASLQVPCPTQRAADFWESARFISIFLASGFFYISNRISARPKSANASRWANNDNEFVEIRT